VIGAFRQGCRLDNLSISKKPLATPISLFRSLILLSSSILGITWICLSAIPMQSICDVSFIPQIAMSIHKASQSFRITSSYGLFRQMTGVGNLDAYTDLSNPPLAKVARPELILEGLVKGTEKWQEIPFKYKPGNIYTSPPWIVPHQPRLDWQMWFAALGNYQQNPWLISLIEKLLTGNSDDVLELLDKKGYPFKETPPVAVRARLFDYDFTNFNTSTRANKVAKAWWTRTKPRDYLPGIEKDNPSVSSFLNGYGISHNPQISFKERYKICIGEPTLLNTNYLLPICRSLICSSFLLRHHLQPDESWVFYSSVIIIAYLILLKYKNIVAKFFTKDQKPNNKEQEDGENAKEEKREGVVNLVSAKEN
jgi:hypothetical protein